MSQLFVASPERMFPTLGDPPQAGSGPAFAAQAKDWELEATAPELGPASDNTSGFPPAELMTAQALTRPTVTPGSPMFGEFTYPRRTWISTIATPALLAQNALLMQPLRPRPSCCASRKPAMTSHLDPLWLPAHPMSGSRTRHPIPLP